MTKKVKDKPPTLTERVTGIEKGIDHIAKQLKDMQATLNGHSYKFRSQTKRLKKTERMHATIRKCHIKITTYNSINNKSVNFYNKVILRMREIQMDYNSLFKKMGSTITFFEKRLPGGNWMPGDPLEEVEVDQAEAVPSSQLQEMEEELDDE